MYKCTVTAAAVLALLVYLAPANAQQSNQRQQSDHQQQQAQPQGAQHQQSRVYMGAMVEPNPAPGAKGATVRDVAPESPAAKAGLEKGDVITAIGDHHVGNFQDLRSALASHKAGDKVVLHIERNGQQKQINVTLQPRPAETERGEQRHFGRDAEQEYGQQGQPGARERNAFLGVQAGELTAEWINRNNVRVERGAVVMSVLPNSPAARAGLRMGDVITKFNGKQVTSADDLSRMVRDAGAGKGVELTVMRGQQERTVNAKLGTAPMGFAEGMPGRGPGAFRDQEFRYGDTGQIIQRLEEQVRQLEQRVRTLEESMKKDHNK